VKFPILSSLSLAEPTKEEKFQSIFLDFRFSISYTSQVQPHKCAVDLLKIITLISAILPLSTLQHLYIFHLFSPTLLLLPIQHTHNLSTSSFVPFIQLFTLLFQYIPYILQSQPTFLSHIYFSTNTSCSTGLTQIIFLPVSSDISWNKNEGRWMNQSQTMKKGSDRHNQTDQKKGCKTEIS